MHLRMRSCVYACPELNFRRTTFNSVFSRRRIVHAQRLRELRSSTDLNRRLSPPYPPYLRSPSVVSVCTPEGRNAYVLLRDQSR